MIGDFVSVVHQYHRRRESLDLRGGEWVEVEGEAALSLCVLMFLILLVHMRKVMCITHCTCIFFFV